MAIDLDELRRIDQFERVGEIVPQDKLRCRRHGCVLSGTVLYAFVVGNMVMKIGTSGTKKSTLYGRIGGEAQEINRNIRDGTLRKEAYKNLANLVIRANKTIEVWAKPCDLASLFAEETRLTLKYDPPWTGSVNADKRQRTESVCTPI